MDCNKTMWDRTIPTERAIALVESPSNLFERYTLMDRGKGEMELIEESCCDDCYKEQQAKQRWMKIQQDAWDSLEAHERELERYSQNGRWQ